MKEEKQNSKKEKKKAKKKRTRQLKDFALKLNENMPKSEVWFLKEVEKINITLYFTQNQPFGRYIPDFINKTYKIIIEIDGSIHNTKAQREKDAKKDRFYKGRGYDVIRIVAYDDYSLKKGIDKLFSCFRKKKTIVERRRSSKKAKKAAKKRQGYSKYSKASKSKAKCPICKVNNVNTSLDFDGLVISTCKSCKKKHNSRQNNNYSIEGSETVKKAE